MASIYRGGRAESTFGPYVNIMGNALVNVGNAATNGTGGSIHLHGVQTAKIDGNKVAESLPLRIVHTVGTPKTRVTGNEFDNTPYPLFEELIFEGAPRVDADGNVVTEQVDENTLQATMEIPQ